MIQQEGQKHGSLWAKQRLVPDVSELPPSIGVSDPIELVQPADIAKRISVTLV
jgi:hypothetical protein